MSEPSKLPELIENLANTCRVEINAADRPADAFPVNLVLPAFFVRPDRKTDWHRDIPVEVWGRINRLIGRYAVVVDSEAAIQQTPFALSHAELRQFRQRPILRVLSLVNTWLTRKRGGRTKREVEIAIRAALEFETFRRDVEIGTLISCMQERYGAGPVRATKGAGINELVRHAWLACVPTKGAAANRSLSEADRRLELFETLRSEGEKLAVSRLPGISRPTDVESAVIAQIRRLAELPWTKSDFETAIARAAGWVRILMKACAHITLLAQEKHKLSKSAGDRQNRPVADVNDSFANEPMSKRQHALFASAEFSAFELAFIATAADVDPNLISANHVLATPEFRLARKLGRAGRNHMTAFATEEIEDLRLVLGEAGCAENAMYKDVHRYLAQCALELLPFNEWGQRIDDAQARKRELVLSD